MPLFRKTLRDLRWQVFGYGFGLASITILYVSLYPTFSEMMSDIQLPEAMQPVVGDISDMSNPRNFFQLELFFFWYPLLLSIWAIVASTAQIAGDDQDGTLELILAHPVSRRRLLIERSMGLAIGAFLIISLAALGMLVSVPFIDLKGEISLWELIVAPFGMLPFTLTLLGLGMLAGTLTSSRGQAVGLTSGFTVAFYLMELLPGFANSLDPLKYGSVFYYSDYKQILLRGVVPLHQLLLLTGTVLSIMFAAVALETREIGTGHSPLRIGRRNQKDS